MTIKSIFLFAPAETADATKGPAAYAISLAKAHGARLTSFTGAVNVTTPGRQTDAVAVATSLRNAAEAADVNCNLVTEHSHAMGVHEVVAEHARLHDLSVTGCSAEGLLSEKIVAEYLMFESGRPLIVVPETHIAAYKAGPITVAWDNTAAAARALGDAIALFDPEQVDFLTIEGEKALPADLDPQSLVQTTERRSVKALHRTAQLAGRSIAVALQQEAGSGSDGLLAMGAYGHSRLRRFVLGSATTDILKNNLMPTLLSH